MLIQFRRNIIIARKHHIKCPAIKFQEGKFNCAAFKVRAMLIYLHILMRIAGFTMWRMLCFPRECFHHTCSNTRQKCRISWRAVSVKNFVLSAAMYLWRCSRFERASKYTTRGQKLFRVALFEKRIPANFVDIAWEIFPKLEAGNDVTHIYSFTNLKILFRHWRVLKHVLAQLEQK